MKITLVLALFISTQLLANTFEFVNQNAATFETDKTYQLISNFHLNIEPLPVFSDDKAVITVNGKTAEFNLRLKETSRRGSETIKVFETTIKKDLLADGACSEYEAVNYSLTFTETSEYTHYAYVTDAKLEAKKLYSYDWCHSHTDVTVYKYSKK